MEVEQMTASSSSCALEDQIRLIQKFMVVGRVEVTRFLQAFTPEKKRKGKNGDRVKFEYARIRLYRSLKRTLRIYFRDRSFALGGVISHPKIMSARFVELVEAIKKLCQSEEKDLRQFADKLSGPNIDHSSDKRPECFKTYNNKYVQCVLKDSAVRRLYQLYVELIFEEPDLSRRCANWKMNCCQDLQHSTQCVEAWDRFKHILMQEIQIYQNDSFVFKRVG